MVFGSVKTLKNLSFLFGNDLIFVVTLQPDFKNHHNNVVIT
jgi:hypothetical protein